jgi:hypothetical protein
LAPGLPPVADQKCVRLLCGVSVIVTEDVAIGLQEESDVGVPIRS